MQKIGIVAVLAIGMLMVNSSATEPSADVDLTKVKCVVNAKAKAKEGKSAEYKAGEVYFCCGGCLAKFKKAPKKFATSANHQLVATGQYKQTKCPYSGGPAKADKSTEVKGVKVSFCCGNCLGKTEKAGDKAAEMIFNDKAFEKGFVAVKKKEK